MGRELGIYFCEIVLNYLIFPYKYLCSVFHSYQALTVGLTMVPNPFVIFSFLRKNWWFWLWSLWICFVWNLCFAWKIREWLFSDKWAKKKMAKRGFSRFLYSWGFGSWDPYFIVLWSSYLFLLSFALFSVEMGSFLAAVCVHLQVWCDLTNKVPPLLISRCNITSALLFFLQSWTSS